MNSTIYNSFCRQERDCLRKEKGCKQVIQKKKMFKAFRKNPKKCNLKNLVSDFGGHCPFGFSSFGKTNQAMTNSALCDFTSNYRKRLSTEWAPVNISRPDPPLMMQPSEIYHRHVGQLPNYGGHIPGAIFRLTNFLWHSFSKFRAR